MVGFRPDLEDDATRLVQGFFDGSGELFVGGREEVDRAEQPALVVPGTEVPQEARGFPGVDLGVGGNRTRAGGTSREEEPEELQQAIEGTNSPHRSEVLRTIGLRNAGRVFGVLDPVARDHDTHSRAGLKPRK